MSTISSNLKKSCTAIILLSLLSEGDSYGYQLTQSIKKRTDNVITLQEGSMYTILYRLIEIGDVESYEVKSGQRMVRVYYKITDNGRSHLKEMKEEFTSQLKAYDLLFHFMEGINSDEE